MEESKNLADLTKDISNQLICSIELPDILEDVVDGERKEYFLVSSLQKNINKAFKDIEICRQMISVPD